MSITTKLHPAKPSHPPFWIARTAVTTPTKLEYISASNSRFDFITGLLILCQNCFGLSNIFISNAILSHQQQYSQANGYRTSNQYPFAHANSCYGSSCTQYCISYVIPEAHLTTKSWHSTFH